MTSTSRRVREALAGPPARPAVTRLMISNYRSIGQASIEFRPLTFLVGPNGSGKSNVLDAMRFIAEAMVKPLDQVLRDRDGIEEVRRKSGGHPSHFGIRIDFTLASGATGWYAIRIGARKPKGFIIAEEECRLVGGGDNLSDAFRLEKGTVKETSQPAVAVVSDRPYLVAISANPVFRQVFDLLSRITIYNINPAVVRELQSTDSGDLLQRDGGNLAAVIRRLGRDAPERMERIEVYLRQVVTSITKILPRALSNRETLEFRQKVQGANTTWRFPASSMSDGTLRALGVLTAIFQRPPTNETDIPIIGIEEPEIAVHPHALAVLLDALVEASGSRQVVVTSHSPDLLDRDTVQDDALLAVTQESGTTVIGPVDEAGRQAIRQRLCTAGELLRQNALNPDLHSVDSTNQGRQMNLFAADV